jgi:hypothetical protein
MADKEQTEAERAAQDRVNKAAFINAEVNERLHQYDGDDFGVKPAKAVREEYPAAKSPRVQGDAKAAPKP